MRFLVVDGGCRCLGWIDGDETCARGVRVRHRRLVLSGIVRKAMSLTVVRCSAYHGRQWNPDFILLTSWMRQGNTVLRFSGSLGIMDLVLILCHLDRVLGFIVDYRHVRMLIEPSRSFLHLMTDFHRTRAWLLGAFNCLNILFSFPIRIMALFC